MASKYTPSFKASIIYFTSSDWSSLFIYSFPWPSKLVSNYIAISGFFFQNLEKFPNFENYQSFLAKKSLKQVCSTFWDFSQFYDITLCLKIKRSISYKNQKTLNAVARRFRCGTLLYYELNFVLLKNPQYWVDLNIDFTVSPDFLEY